METYSNIELKNNKRVLESSLTLWFSRLQTFIYDSVVTKIIFFGIFLIVNQIFSKCLKNFKQYQTNCSKKLVVFPDFAMTFALLCLKKTNENV